MSKTNPLQTLTPLPIPKLPLRVLLIVKLPRTEKARIQIPQLERAKAAHDTPVTLTVSVVGDCTLGTDENFDYDTSLNAYFESYGKEYFFQNVKSIFEADDLTIANNEGTFTESYDREDKTFAFKAPASFAGIYSCSSVEAVNTANNHSHDYGRAELPGHYGRTGTPKESFTLAMMKLLLWT